jgi:DNA-binding GntR family transcriptional regulator
MPYEYTPPKYAQLIQEIQRRIESGEYPAGSPLPSEHQLSQMFHVARATVARALQVLRQDGWIVTQQGRGSFARGRPPWIALKSRTAEGAGLDRDEAAEQGDPVEVDVRVPSARVAEILGGDSERPVLVRQRLLRSGQDACELVSWWVPADLADGTGLADPELIEGGVLKHLAQRKGVRVHHVVEQIAARHPTAREVRLLDVEETAAMLVMYLAAHDVNDTPILVLQVVMPGREQELENVYPFT